MTGFVPPRGAEHWLSRAEMTQQTWGYAADRLLLGVLPDDASVPVGRPDDRHLVTIAGSRAGKSTTMLLPNLRLHQGSAVVIDPKGELARIAAPWRRQIGKVVVLDPFNLTGERDAHGWNPFEELTRLPAELLPDEAAMVAEALIIDDGRDSHWVQAARNLVRGVVLQLASL